MESEQNIRKALAKNSKKKYTNWQPVTVATLADNISVIYDPRFDSYVLDGNDTNFKTPLRFDTIRLVEWSNGEQMYVIGERTYSQRASLWSSIRDGVAFGFLEQFVRDGYRVPTITKWRKEQQEDEAGKKRKATEVLK